MTDLEMMRLCAQAMGYIRTDREISDEDFKNWQSYESLGNGWNPLEGNEALEMVERFHIQVWPTTKPQHGDVEYTGWTAYIFKNGSASDPDLRRAIVTVVAKMQVSATPAVTVNKGT